MKKIILITLLTVGAYFGWENQSEVMSFISTPDSASIVSKPLRTENWKWMYRQNKKFEDLSINGSYTVVFITSPDCERCSEIQNGLNDFVEARNDVAIYRLNIQLNPSTINNDNQSIKEHERRFLEDMFTEYDVDTTPHIEVYSPTGELLASDRGDSKSGYKYFRKWIEIETKSKR